MEKRGMLKMSWREMGVEGKVRREESGENLR